MARGLVYRRKQQKKQGQNVRNKDKERTEGRNKKRITDKGSEKRGKCSGLLMQHPMTDGSI